MFLFHGIIIIFNLCFNKSTYYQSLFWQIYSLWRYFDETSSTKKCQEAIPWNACLSPSGCLLHLYIYFLNNEGVLFTPLCRVRCIFPKHDRGLERRRFTLLIDTLWWYIWAVHVSVPKQFHNVVITSFKIRHNTPQTCCQLHPAMRDPSGQDLYRRHVNTTTHST